MYYAQILGDVADKTSTLERRAEEVERETVKLKKAEYMETRLGQNYEGIISGVTGWGLYVELPNTMEGLVHISTLMDDYYQFDEEAYCLTGEKTGHTYRLGQKVTVKVSQVDLSTKSIDFILKEALQFLFLCHQSNLETLYASHESTQKIYLITLQFLYFLMFLTFKFNLHF